MRLTLASKLTIFIGAAMALVVMTMTFIVTVYVQKSLERANHVRCLSSASSLARHITAPLISKNLYLLHEHLQYSIKLGLFNSVALLDKAGKVIMHSDLYEVGKFYSDEQSNKALKADKPIFSEIYQTENGSLEDKVFVPVFAAGIRLGTLLLGHSHEEIEETIGNARKWFFGVGLIATVICIAMANFLTAIATRPIRYLTEATRRVTRGELDLSVEVDMDDELGILARSFNTMTQELNKTTVSYDYLNNIFNSAGDAIRTINLDYDVDMNNRSMADFLNLDQESIQGNKCFQLLQSEICNTESCVLKRILNGETIVEVDTEVRLYDGRKRHVCCTATPLMDNNQIVGVIESIQDITDQKLAEDESRSLQNQLVQAQKMESVGRLAGGIAHDFNNILSIILGYSDLGLLVIPPDHPLSEKLQQIADAARKAEALVRQLLAFSRKQILEKSVLNLNDVIANMMKMLGRIIGEDVKLEVSLPESSRRIFADQSQLVQVLMNLAVNARDAMPDGGKLFVETADIDLDEEYSRLYDYVQPGKYVMLSVTDTGIGISKKVIKNIFEPFFTTKGPEAGTGLGLSTVYGTIKQHGGHVHVYSEPDFGTTFKIYLPITGRETVVEGSDDKLHVREGNETVLLVDDDITIRRLIIDILQPYGYQIFDAGSGEKALDLIETIESKIDILLTDVVMPGMNGKELAQKTRALTPETKIIYMSGYIQNAIGQNDLDRDTTFFIQKPITPKLLFDKFSEVLDE